MNVLGPGDVFGEMAFLLELPRQSDVYAATPGVRILSLSDGTLHRLMAEEPVLAAKLLFNISRMLCGRLIKANADSLRHVIAPVWRKSDDWRVSSTATEMVAVLMTDLVGSTAIADRVGPGAAEELRTEHFGLLRAALERTGGREVKNLGDGLMVVFSSASESLSCAARMQQAVEARNRRSQEWLEVRIGLSLGEATVQDGDYFGEPVVEAARLCARAAGGQIVVNALVRQLAGSRDGHSFKSLGGLELRGSRSRFRRSSFSGSRHR